MIRITVDLIPFGIESSKRTIGIMKIWNDASGSRNKGNYKFTVSKCGKAVSQSWKKGEVKNFPRLRKNVWALLLLALQEVMKKEEQ